MNAEQNNIQKKLFKTKKSDYGENFHSHMIEQYKIYIEMSDHISARRQNANSFFLTLNTVIIAFVGYVNMGDKSLSAFYWFISIAGMLLCFMWYKLIRSYRDLNSAKFKVVHAIESHLPIAPFEAEWEISQRGSNSKLYLPFTHVEIYIPWVFFAVHFFVLLRCFL